ncbi:ATP-binding protein [Quadrisphaera sp. INWT6]|uniref:ATP-binding protein n=1 Tax=Quadrisphaera sp. INWT6 TaxID=2596917 RepID=UPI0018925585|nr:ATP-binding protein [Quadrisphaera sp. INWT6]MBF5081948.1 ATP-binding protein [Quadrisphaera sp. INWT6]
MRLPKDTRAPLLARAFVRKELGELHSVEVRDRVELLASELVTNAVVHAGSLVTMDVVSEASGAVLVEVADGSPVHPVLRETELLDESGRGLELVDKLSVEWGVREGGLRELEPVSPAGGTDAERGSTPALPAALAAALGGRVPRQATGKVVWFRVSD